MAAAYISLFYQEMSFRSQIKEQERSVSVAPEGLNLWNQHVIRNNKEK